MRDWQIIKNTVGTLCWDLNGIIKYFVISFCAKTILQEDSTHAMKCMFRNLNLFSYVTLVTKAMPKLFCFLFFFCILLFFLCLITFSSFFEDIIILEFVFACPWILHCTRPEFSVLLIQLHAFIIMGIDTLNRRMWIGITPLLDVFLIFFSRCLFEPSCK